MRKPGYLLERFLRLEPASTGFPAAFDAEIRLRQLVLLPQFCFLVLYKVVSPLPRLLQIARQKAPPA